MFDDRLLLIASHGEKYARPIYRRICACDAGRIESSKKNKSILVAKDYKWKRGKK